MLLGLRELNLSKLSSLVHKISCYVKITFSHLRNENLLAAFLLICTLAFFYRDVVFGGRTFLLEGTERGTMPLPAVGPYGYEGPTFGFVWDASAIANAVEPWDKFI